MIPKIIHYCWFGRGQMPKLALDCIASWKKYCPDYIIKEWNEDNFDLNMFPYVREAYDNRKFAFVTDVVRLYALYTEGGVYMDTDVEVIQPIDRFLNLQAFSGFQTEDSYPTGIMASVKGGKWAKDNLDYYKGKHFVKDDGSLDLTTNVDTIMRLLEPYGIKADNTFQEIPDYFTLYPKEYFCPIEHVHNIILTENSYTIHHFAGSWLPWTEKMKRRIIKLCGKRVWNVIIKIRSLLCMKTI